MAAPFVVLGLKATDKLVDDHLHKLPDKYFYSSTYNPLSKSKKNRKGSKDSNTGSQDRDIKEGDEDIPTVEEPKEYNKTFPKMAAHPGPPPAMTGDIYSRDPPMVRQQYIPPTAMAAGAGVAAAPYFPPPPTEPYDYGYEQGNTTDDYGRRHSGDDYGRRDSRDDYDRRDSKRGHGHRGSRRYDDDDSGDDESYYSSSRRYSRPKAVTRRSSSHPGHGSRGSYDNDYDGRQYDTGSQHVDRAMDRAHRYGVKDELKDTFTHSKAGLAGSAVGALVGGWAASKAQVAYDKKNREKANPLLTLLGAAVGGLAVNAVIDKFEDEKRDANDKQDKWDEKFGKGGGSERGGDQDGSDRESEDDKKSRRRSRRQDRGYDSGYD